MRCSFSDFVRSCLTGSYHNYFRIYDVETTQDVVLQADKSAFKSKKLGGPSGKGLKGNGIKKESMNIDTIDFNKKILHASWHPHENTIAVSSFLTVSPFRNNLIDRQIAATNNLFLVSTFIFILTSCLLIVSSDTVHGDLASQTDILVLIYITSAFFLHILLDQIYIHSDRAKKC